MRLRVAVRQAQPLPLCDACANNVGFGRFFARRGLAEERPRPPRSPITLQRSEMRQSREVVGTPSGAAVLAAVETLIDRARTLQDLESQGLQLLAARRWRELGRPVPSRLLAQERVVAANLLVAPAVLRRIRSAYDGDILLLKGPEVAIAYPDAALRPYGDLDLLVSDAHAAQRALTAAGFEPVGNEAGYVTKHHLQPL